MQHLSTQPSDFYSYDLLLIGLSYLVAVLASLTALDLAARVRGGSGRLRLPWLLAGAMTMGLGIWSMHFIGMMALHTGMTMRYDLLQTVLSLLLAVAAAGLAFTFVTQPRLTLPRLLLSGFTMGGGVAAMHYLGMAAMRTSAALSYRPGIFALSVAIAVAASVVALWLVFYFSRAEERRAEEPSLSGRTLLGLKGLSALVMGAAIAGMHYTGMAAARFEPLPGGAPTELAMRELAGGSISASGLGVPLTLATLLILGLTLLSTLIDRRFTQQADFLHASERRYRSLFEYHPDAVFTVDLAGRFTSANPISQQSFGYSVTELLQLAIHTLIVPEHQARVYRAVQKVVRGEPQRFEAAVFHRDGRRLELLLTAVPNIVGGQVVGGFCIARDVTDHKALEHQLQHQAFHDVLTGLANRALYLDRLGVALERTKRNPERHFAVLFLDFDNFKKINDSLGHAVGDALLVAIGERLQLCLRPADTAARLGGDEFVLLLEDITSPDDALHVAERIQQVLAQPFTILGHDLSISASLGIVVSDSSYTYADDLLRDADIAMYQAKARGKACYVLFDVGMRERTLALLELEADLHSAAAKGELEVHYQPVMAAGSGELIGFEALVRWNHPRLGLVSPAEFIPVAEELGLIVEIDRWVLARACAQLQQWRALSATTLSLSVNMSSQQFTQPDFAAYVEHTLQQHQLEPRHLNLEVTERIIMDDSQQVRCCLERLRTLGVELHIDDFGTGYSSLGYLQRFSATTLKIDRSFVSRISLHPDSAELVRTIVAMAHNLGMQVVAEGVETEAQLREVQRTGCEYAQGYLFSKPLAAAAAEHLLVSSRRAVVN